MNTKKRPAETTPLRVLLGDYHLRLLALLLLRPDEDFHLHQIGRMTGVPASSARRELQRFVAVGLLVSRRVGNQVRYQANRSSNVFEELAGMLRKTVGMAEPLREALSPLAKRIKTAFLFGSAAQGREGPYSDIDLMVIGTASFEEVVAVVKSAEKQLGREINPVIFSPREFLAKVKTKEAFIRRVVSEPKIMLIGALDEP